MVNNIDTKVRYRGNGSNRVFPITFPFTDDDYVCVRIANDETGEVRELTSDFLVDNIANTVTYPGWATGQEPPVADQPAVLTSDETITIYRKTEISQLTELGIKFPLPQIERALDKVTNILQEHDEAIVRSVKVDISSEEEAGYYYEQMMVAANNAVESATAAAGSATSAANSASAAASSETAAAISATNASDSASAAAASALSASNSATSAGTSATNAAASESVAGNAATSATASASAAATSAESASASQLAAAASAGTAASYAETSTTNASVAQSAANTCSSVLPQVLGAASNVATKANAAAASATAAALSASSAASDAQTAGNAATTATTKAGEAAASAVAAATSAASAADSATAASTSYDQAAVAVVNILDIVAEAAVTYPAQSGTQTYTGNVQTPTWDSYYQPNKMVITGDTSATNAGTYTVTFTPKSGYYWLADDTTTAKTQTWTIGRASIAAEPSQSGVVVYDGTAQSPTWSGYDSSQLTIGGDTSGTEAGTYTATFTPTGNYKWYDGTTTAKSVTWTISAASVTIPTVTNTSKTYNGQSQAPTITGLDPLTVDVIDDANAINAGSYMITFHLKSPSLVWSDMTTVDKSVGWTIGPKTVTAPTITVSTLTYDGTAQGPVIGSYDTDAILISGTTSAVAAGSYSVICSLLSATNYVWSDTTTEPISTSWSILPLAVAVPSLSNTSKTYDGTAQSPTISPYDSNIVDVSGTVTATDAGTYTVTFHLLNASVKWSDNSTADKSDTWTIAPKPVTAPSVTDTSKTYTGSSQSPTIDAFSATEITQGGTDSATNAGNYSVTFDLASANYIWSDDTTTQKSVSWSIAKAAGSLTLSKSSVSLTASKTSDTVTVTRSGDGTITATSSNSSIATASVSGTTVTIRGIATGSATITVNVAAGTNHLAPTSTTVSVAVQFFPTVLNDATWAQIQQAAQSGQAANCWDVGDRKEVILNGSVAGRTLSNKKWYCYILGFDHNAAKEGNNTIHFQFGFNALSGGVKTALTQNYRGKTGGFYMNYYSSNAGGWSNSDMRKTKIPEFRNCLPSDLKSVLKTITKYTDNNGYGTSIESNVTATQDDIFLLAEYEVFGSRTSANQYEYTDGKQAQYDFYKLGNSKAMVNDKSTGDNVDWWFRSPGTSNNTFCFLYSGSLVSASYAEYSIGFAPGFCVG